MSDADARELMHESMRIALVDFLRRDGRAADQVATLLSTLETIEQAIVNASGAGEIQLSESQRRELATELDRTGGVADLVVLSQIISSFMMEISRLLRLPPSPVRLPDVTLQ